MASGRIRNIELYQQGKMLDHSGWRTILVRGITGSDVDLVFDFNGLILVVELKLNCNTFSALPTGQRILYENFVKAGKGKIIAACAKITPTSDKPVDTLNDVHSFQVLTFSELSPVLPGSEWKKFVLAVQDASKS